MQRQERWFAHGRVVWALVLGMGSLVPGARRADAMTVLRQNVEQLVSLSKDIVVGKVVSVVDGIDGGMPFTKVTLHVTEAIKGSSVEVPYGGGEYSFRQFGLSRPRPGPYGTTNLNVTPQGWPRFAEGEEVLLFLYTPASRTGLRTTVGLDQGKFTIANGHALNGAGNVGLFRDVSLDARALAPRSVTSCRRSVGR